MGSPVGPSGLVFLSKREPRPNGRGYCMTALRALDPIAPDTDLSTRSLTRPVLISYTECAKICEKSTLVD